MKAAAFVMGVVLAAGCGVSTNQMYVPMAEGARAPKPGDNVLLLEREPTDRPFTVIGLISPPEDEYDSYAEMLNAARRVAASKGADAIYVAATKTESGWTNTNDGRTEASSTEITAIQVKAIVWK